MNTELTMSDFKIDETSGLPVWIQLRNRLIYLIKSGHYKPGEQLPSVRTLAAELSINYNTVSKTYVGLEQDGYVTSVRGRGVFVNDVTAGQRDDMMNAVDTVLEDAMRKCLSMGLTLDEVKLRMMDVAYELKHESDTISQRRKNLR